MGGIRRDCVGIGGKVKGLQRVNECGSLLFYKSEKWLKSVHNNIRFAHYLRKLNGDECAGHMLSLSASCGLA
jgi:hypothetical protein